jgi:hypothetical protein
VTKASRFVGTGSLLTAGTATLVAALTLRDARRYMELVETRMGHLREEQANLREEQASLLVLLREERQILQEESKREREWRVEAQQKAERLSREFQQLRQKQEQLAKEFERERVKHLEYQRQARQWARQEREERERERRDAEQRIDHLKRELQELRELQQNREIQRDSSPPVPAGLLEERTETQELPQEKPLPAPRAPGTERTPPPTSSPAKRAAGPPEISSKDKGSRLGVRLPHPDDGDGRGGATPGQPQTGNDAPVEMFRKYYDRYVENYQGYVELAERLYQMRDNGEISTGSSGEREWEERLRRANDGIERTTSRLDILEEHNPELATDDRISHRASVARRHSELEKRGRSV